MEMLNKVLKTTKIAIIDKYTIDNEPISSLGLMERAAEIWTEYFLKIIKKNFSVAIVAGSGNNGGDGYVIARLLKQRGWNVIVLQLSENTPMTADCEENYRRWQTLGEVKLIRRVEDLELAAEVVIIDAIFGSGLNRPVTGLCAEVIKRINQLPNTVVAVDVPSGLMGEDNSNNDRTAIICADYTFTFQFPKLAFMLPENEKQVGEWHVLDIGLHPDAISQAHTNYYYTTIEQVAAMLPRPNKFAHKGTNGHGLLIAGMQDMTGAAVLAAKAAVRSGIGLLTCNIPRASKEIVQMSVPEVLIDMARHKFYFAGASMETPYQAVAVGPGIGQYGVTVDGLTRLLHEWRGITIIDADALNIMAKHRELLELLHDGCILTPHVKEFERLAGKSENDFERLNKLSKFAIHYNVCVILKGAHTVVASPDGCFYFNMTGNPGMAKGGSGDVLTGILLALAANGIEPVKAAIIGVCAHGLSGDMLAKKHGMRGICAGMLAEGMGEVWNKLELIN